jgi:hypothetical protein
MWYFRWPHYHWTTRKAQVIINYTFYISTMIWRWGYSIIPIHSAVDLTKRKLFDGPTKPHSPLPAAAKTLASDGFNPFRNEFKAQYMACNVGSLQLATLDQHVVSFAWVVAWANLGIVEREKILGKNMEKMCFFHLNCWVRKLWNCWVWKKIGNKYRHWGFGLQTSRRGLGEGCHYNTWLCATLRSYTLYIVDSTPSRWRIHANSFFELTFQYLYTGCTIAPLEAALLYGSEAGSRK